MSGQAASAPIATEAPLRVIVADDDAFARRVITGALRAASMIVIAQAKNGHEAVELSLHFKPDIVVMDAVMPGLDGIGATRRLLEANPAQLVVVLTRGCEDELGLPALLAGAVGFLSKEVDIDALPRALQGVRGGEAAISREMTRRLIEQFRGAANGSSGLRPIRSPLTSREWEVIDLLKLDCSPDDVAQTLVLAPETVRSHLKSIMRKLGAHSRRDAVAAAERLRIATPESTD